MAEKVIDQLLVENETLYKIRHTTAHVMAEAVLQLFPGAKIAIGPPIENGFYYDFDLPRKLQNEDLEKIEEKMRDIIKGGHEMVKKVISRNEAKDLFQDQPYKLELVDAIPEGDEVSLYTVDTFTDLCRGPHVENTKNLNWKSFKLLNIAGAYWRGDEKKQMLTRIYGTAWENPKDLRAHLERLKEIEKRDHRKLGKELDLFSLHEEAGPGLVYWHPKGARIRHEIESYWKNTHYANGYELVNTPHVGKSWLWETSGHLDFYNDSMFNSMEMDASDYYAKPMNCPFHIMIYNTGKHSYRELPFRWAELGTVYRYEKSGVLHGLLRVRGFTQDDAHIICTPDQVEDEILEVLRFSMSMLHDFGFEEINAYLSTQPEKAVGEASDWDKAQVSLEKALKAENVPYEVDEGGGAFYGPKIDLKIKDAVGREWQLSTIQFDFNLPNRFDMTFVDSDGKEKRPFMVHRALLGSIERFFGVLVEHYAGAFPVWLCPVQLMVVPVAEAFDDDAAKIAGNLRAEGFRAESDLSDDRLNAKVRKHQAAKIPYTIIIGEQEVENNTVSVRTRTNERMDGIPMEEFIDFTRKKIDEKEEI